MTTTIKLTTVFILLFSTLISAQHSQVEIDSLIDSELTKLRRNADYEGIITLSKEIIKSSNKLNYKKGEAWGYTHLGNALCTLGKYQESLASLQKAKKIAEIVENNELNAQISVETGRNYADSKISFPQAIQKFKEAIQHAKKVENDYDRDTYLLYAYQNLSTSHSNLNQYDSALIYLWKSQNIEEEPYNLITIAYNYSHYIKQPDSLKYYLEKSNDLIEKFPEYIFEKSILTNLWGKYYEDQNDPQTAIQYYLQAEKLAKESKSFPEFLIAVQSLARCYEKLGKFELSTKYLNRYSRINDSIQNAKTKLIDHSIQHIVKDKEENFLKRLSNLQIIFLVIVVISLAIIVVLFIKMVNNQKRKIEAQALIDEKETLLDLKEKETQILKQKVNESFDEIIELAKNNSPEFWGRFQEIYPEFRIKLLEINPELKPSELILAAYTFLGFNTKDIADYTFKAVQTIKNNKRNLRKKLGLATEENFSVWIRNVLD